MTERIVANAAPWNGMIESFLFMIEIDVLQRLSSVVVPIYRHVVMVAFVHLVYLVKITEKHRKMMVSLQAVVVIVYYVVVVVVLLIDQLDNVFEKHMD